MQSNLIFRDWGDRVGLIKWGPRYSVGVEAIDIQHQELFRLVNQLYDAMQAGNGKNQIGAILADVTRYADFHLKAEEQMLSKLGYPDLATHLEEHAELRLKTSRLSIEHELGKHQITIDVMLFLSGWLNRHILETDQAYSNFVRTKGVI